MVSRYVCVMADHDDNAVDSTGNIHHPIYLEIMEKRRPGTEPLDFQGFIAMNRNGGIKNHYLNDLGFDQEEWEWAYSYWVDHPLRQMNPPFFDGYLDIMSRFKFEGGIYVVVSHSNEDPIRRHYKEATDGSLTLDMVFGSEYGSKNKPDPLPIDMVMEEYRLSPEEIIVIDDLDPGIDMARKRDVDTIGTGWSHDNPDSFKEKCTYYTEDVKDLERILF